MNTGQINSDYHLYKRQLDEAKKRIAELEQALRDVKEWVDRYTSPGHPVSTVCAKALKGNL